MGEVDKNRCREKGELVANMTSSAKVAYLALVGHPLLEVASIVTLRGQTVDLLHHFIFYFNDIAESCLAEPEPVTDSFGTRFEHAISEMELSRRNTLLLCHVREKLQRFLYAHDIAYLVVNNLAQYQYLQLPYNVNQVWSECTPSIEALHIKKDIRERILEGVQCRGHLSSYYQFDNTKEATCALMLAARMAYDLNYV